jgi:hypothetical protein
MKTIKLFFISILSALSLLSCKTDDEFYNAVYITVPNLITIDIPASYTVGDNLTFHSDFSRYLQEDGLSTPLDIYRTSYAESFGFAYRLEKETAPGVWTSVLLSGDEFSIGDAVYQSGTMTYEFDKSIQLTSTGEYRLGFGESYTGKQSTDLISRNPQNKTSVTITTTANNIDSDGYYRFTVN